MHGFTWNRDSHSLFDTEIKNSDMKKTTFTITKECSVVRKNDTVQLSHFDFKDNEDK